MPLDQEFDALITACDQMAMPVWIADPQSSECRLIHTNSLFCDLSEDMRKVCRGQCCMYSERAIADALPEACRACRSYTTLTTCRPGYREDRSRRLTLLTVRPLYVRDDRFLVAGFQHECRPSATRIGFDHYVKKVSSLLQEIDGRTGYLRGSSEDIDTVRLNVVLMRFNSAHARLKNALLRSRVSTRCTSTPNAEPSGAPFWPYGASVGGIVAEAG